MTSFAPDWSDRFWSKVHPEALSGCWLWHGVMNRGGYGRVFQGRMVLAHRHAFELVCGPIPNGAFVLHRCDVRACVNPEHLFLGTHAENMADMVAKGRAARVVGESRWRAKLSDADVRRVRALSSTGLLQREIGALVGVSAQHVGAILRGRTRREAGGDREGTLLGAAARLAGLAVTR